MRGFLRRQGKMRPIGGAGRAGKTLGESLPLYARRARFGARGPWALSLPLIQ